MAEESSLVKILYEKLVKPSLRTPPSSRYYKVNAIDACFGQWLINVALFYPNGSFHGGSSSSTKEEVFEVLETSLSKTLTYCYPFAGRFMDDDITIDCNDEGVELWQVQIQGSMFEILNNRVDYHPWNSGFLHKKYRCVRSHVMIQLSYFDCGGICIVVYFWHKLGDGVTLSNFINDWAVITCESQVGLALSIVDLTGASILRPPNGTITTRMYERGIGRRVAHLTKIT